MKRKADTQSNGHDGKGILKKRAKTDSEPYKYGVISSLINDELLRSVRSEIKDNVHFTPKETDIYKIHQSGDLANLDGLDNAALEKLPSLLRLRDALYSTAFRKYVATITGSGELSGRKTDMAINVYTPGCHLLCHDDVIGSRRVSYILYLTDPDIPWKEEWGGALRLFPTKTFEDENGEKTKVPSPDFTKVLPPAWNQLSFFAVQPGESFHDVEEVYHAANKEALEKEGGRIRMAISGWYHIPQIGEDGYIKGAEEKWGANSSLLQLQGNPDRYDFPQEQPSTVEIPIESADDKGFEEADLDFLLKYMAPTYLTPDTLEQVSEQFLEMSSVTLDGLLSKKYAEKMKTYIEKQEATPLPPTSAEIEKGSWKVARPPHKHRFLYRQPSNKTSLEKESSELDPITELLQVFLPSPQFRKWLQIATECEIENYDLIARRFRKGLDYSLATSHDGQPRLELGLGLTPTPGWGADEDEEEGDGDEMKPNGSDKKSIRAGTPNGNKIAEEEDDPEDVGGHEVYMAGDDDEADGDAAVYKTFSDAEDDNVLFTMLASWNKLSIVLRDSGVLKFVKYVSKSAKGDRWDISASYGVKEIDDGDDVEGLEEMVALESSDEEEVFNGFPDSEDSDSD
ncbi:uS12 prolyl 3 [Hyphodiscus hymeniophilus]|uniref:uS12 prolyl 3,4-dihydroxylase n=1 Tax=Hyphodiscus hymeniophilus TaxID=353542 RepID=A0A9P6VHY1_9HELO|nr:uS12 prolyl 3 [Hyphodiscus hymeniophilus]